MTTPTLREAAMAALEALEDVCSRLEWTCGGADNPESPSRKGFGTAQTLRLALTAPEQSPADGGQAWRDHVEQRMLTWRQSFVNKSGDQLALDDFMDKRSLEDLIDYVCDEWATPAAPTSGEPVATLHDDGMFTWKRDEFRRLYDRPHAGWRMDVYATPPSAAQAEGARDLAKRIKAEAAHWAYMAEIDNSDAAQLANHNLGLLVDQLAALTAAPAKVEGNAVWRAITAVEDVRRHLPEGHPIIDRSLSELRALLDVPPKPALEAAFDEMVGKPLILAATAPHQQAGQKQVSGQLDGANVASPIGDGVRDGLTTHVAPPNGLIWHNPAPDASAPLVGTPSTVVQVHYTPPSPQQAAQSGEREAFEIAHRAAFGRRVVVAGYEDAPYKKLPNGEYADVCVGDTWTIWQARAALRAHPQPAPQAAVQAAQGLVPLSEGQIEDCIDAANRKFKSRRQGPSGQLMTAYDDWKHWLAREVERAHGIRPAGDEGAGNG